MMGWGVLLIIKVFKICAVNRNCIIQKRLIKMKRTAFTLAEVLISLAIIGVIAALTLPSISRLNQEASIGPRLAKIQSSMEEATGRVMLDDPSKALKEIEGLEEKLAKHLAMQKEGEGWSIKDGLQIEFGDPTGVVPKAAGEGYKDVIVDINGRNTNPNVEGVDKFRFTLSSHGLMIAQGCAGLIQENNWKTPRDYDFSACLSYQPGTDIPDDDNTPEEEPDEKDPTTKTCADGTVVPLNAICKKQCPNGKYIPEDQECETGYTCPDGKVVVDASLCDEAIQPPEEELPDEETIECPDGTTISKNEVCPIQCWDGSWVTPPAPCPVETKTCEDGSTVNVDENCPVQCWDGSWVQDSANCPPENNVGEPTDMTFNVYGYSTSDGYNIMVGVTLAEPLPYDVTFSGRFENKGSAAARCQPCVIPAGQLSCMPDTSSGGSLELMDWSPGMVDNFYAYVSVDGRDLYEENGVMYYQDTREPLEGLSFNVSSDNTEFKVQVTDDNNLWK